MNEEKPSTTHPRFSVELDAEGWKTVIEVLQTNRDFAQRRTLDFGWAGEESVARWQKLAETNQAWIDELQKQLPKDWMIAK